MQVTPAARSELLRFLSALADRPGSAQPEPPKTLPTANPSVRLAVIPGGCAGWSYHLDPAPRPIEGDQVLRFDRLELRVDPSSWPLLEALSIDYSEDLMGGSFRFSNPGAAQSCSCGQSFAPLPSPIVGQASPHYSI
jgi:iron-sulfur cluster assembly protein